MLRLSMSGLFAPGCVFRCTGRYLLTTFFGFRFVFVEAVWRVCLWNDLKNFAGSITGRIEIARFVRADAAYCGTCFHEKGTLPAVSFSLQSPDAALAEIGVYEDRRDHGAADNDAFPLSMVIDGYGVGQFVYIAGPAAVVSLPETIPVVFPSNAVGFLKVDLLFLNSAGVRSFIVIMLRRSHGTRAPNRSEPELGLPRCTLVEPFNLF